MKAFFSFCILCCITLFTLGSFQAHGLEWRIGEEVTTHETISGDMYTAGGRIDISAPVEGDFVGAGGEIFIDAEVSEDLILAGGDITISNTVGDDIRVAAGQVRIQADIAGDLIVFAGTVDIAQGVSIGGDIVAHVGELSIDGKVLGNLTGSVGELSLKGEVGGDVDIKIGDFEASSVPGVVGGNLSYESAEQFLELEALVGGTVLFEQEHRDSLSEEVLEAVITFIHVVVLGVFLFAVLLYRFCGNTWKDLGTRFSQDIAKHGWYGFMFVVGVPFVIILLMITVIGIPFGLLLLMLYIFVFVFLALVNTLVVGAWVIDKYGINKWYYRYSILLIGAAIFALVTIVNLIVGFFVLGTLIHAGMEKWRK